MKPFTKLRPNVATCMEHRLVLLQQPSEFYRPFFAGRTPSMAEKMLYVEQAVQRMTATHIYENDVYRVELFCSPPFIDLDIRRHDGGVCTDRRELQQIKSALVGPEHEAVELFPAESRLVDTANQYHLWVHVDPAFRFPIGFGANDSIHSPAAEENWFQAHRPAAGTADLCLAERVA
jgi:hypothetical protein